jgi:hypothetical protein
MPSLRRMIAVAPLLLAGACLAAVQTPSNAPRSSWLSMYFNNSKIGYTEIHVSPEKVDGKPGFRMTSRSVIKMELLGNSVTQDTSTATLSDDKYAVRNQEYVIKSNGSTLRLTATYKSSVIDCVVDSGGGPTKKQIPIPAGARIMADSNAVTLGQTLNAGDELKMYTLNPLTLSLDPVTIKVIGEETVKIAGKEVKTLCVKANMSLGSMTSWEVPGGDLVKGEMAVAGMNMSMYSATKEEALDPKAAPPAFERMSIAGSASSGKTEYVPPPDFALATAIKVEKPIPNPRKLKALKLTLDSDQEIKLPPNDTRQTSIRGSKTVINVKSQAFGAAESVNLPIKNAAVSAYQGSAPYLETADSQIQAVAKQVKGSEKNAFKVATALSAWVHKHMKPDYTIGVPRSCAEVLRKNRGVCRDYATLMAGLARAAGIPTRLAGGIVYAEGKFFYHAWVECWVGDWIAFDPTQNGAPVDATHVKFSQGDVTDMYRFADHVGRIRVANLEYP